jgi:hypothetical protein
MSIRDNLDRETYGDLMYRLGQMDAILQDLQSTINRFHDESRRIREGQPPELVRALDEVLGRTPEAEEVEE